MSRFSLQNGIIFRTHVQDNLLDISSTKRRKAIISLVANLSPNRPIQDVR
jgi:hypothetical protein